MKNIIRYKNKNTDQELLTGYADAVYCTGAFILTGIILWLLSGCTLGPISSKGPQDSYNLKEITSFNFNAAQNPGLSSDYTGSISGTTITVTLPESTDVTALIAVFETTGQEVSITGIHQTSGVTANDFTTPVVYTVTAVNSTSLDYITNILFTAPVIPEIPLDVAAPVFSQSGGIFVTREIISISTSTEEADIRYTTDGTNPTSADPAYPAPVNVTITTTTTLTAVACKDGWTDSAPVQATYTLVIPDHTVVGGIQTVIDAAAGGELIFIPAGIYTENLTIAKQITLMGDGNNTIIRSAGAIDDPVIEIQSGGSSAANRLILKNLYLTDGVHGAGFWGSGIHFSADTDYITIENVACAGNDDYGIHLNVVDTVTDIVVNNCDLSNNGLHGIRVAGVTTPDGLVISNSRFEWNADAGFLSYTSDVNASITISDCLFANNATGIHTTGDIVFSGFNGDVSLANLIINSNGCESGIRISGDRDVSYNPYNAGIMSFSGLTINGIQASCGTYPSAAFTITRYADLSNVTFHNITLNSTAPHGVFIGTLTGTGMDLGDIIFNGIYTDYDLCLGQHGNSGSYGKATVNVDATGAVFKGAVNDAEIENCVYHHADDSELGLVTWTTP